MSDSTGMYGFVGTTRIYSRSIDLASVERISAFPDPYYASPEIPTSTYVRVRPCVTFNDLSQRATTRIFNLAGHLVQTLSKGNASQFLEWDLQNEDRWLVANGMYVCHVGLPDLGVSMALKLGIIAAREGMR